MVDAWLEKLVELMDSVSVTELAAVAAGAFLLLFAVVVVHELGHAVVALVCTEGLVLVAVGRSPGLLRGRVGRLAFRLDPRPVEDGGAGWTWVVADLNRREQIAYTLAGPAANICLALFLVPLLGAVSGTPRYVVGGAIALSALVALWALVPVGPDHDGSHLLAAARGDVVVDGSTGGEFTNAVGRWMALYSSKREFMASDQRAYLFGGALRELGVDPQVSGDEAAAYWSAARAGWCWREVRPSAPASLSNGPQEAWRSLSREGLVGLELAAAAAVLLARDDGEPDANEDVEAAFLVTNDLRSAASPDERSRFAFRYGVALHDVEQVMAEHGERYW